MNPKEYIQSGILELYVQGTASSQEMQEVECMSHIYPEIREELTRLEQSLEKYVDLYAVTPPQDLRAKILANASQTVLSGAQNTTESANQLPDQKAKEVPVIPIWIQTISVAASVAAVLFGIQTWKGTKEINTLQQELVISNTENLGLASSLKEKENLLDLSLSPSTSKIDLNAVKETFPDAKVSVLWNVETESVYLTVHNLPTPSDGKQYQLWAIVGGAPVDLGMLSLEDSGAKVQLMKTVKEPQAFAITLEDKGGVPSPTLEEMYVLGTVAPK